MRSDEILTDNFAHQYFWSWRSNQQRVEILCQIDVVNSFTCGHDTLSAVFIDEQTSYAVVKVHFIERRGRFRLKNCAVMVPDVKISIVNT